MVVIAAALVLDLFIVADVNGGALKLDGRLWRLSIKLSLELEPGDRGEHQK